MHQAALILSAIVALLVPRMAFAQANLPRAYMLDMKVDPEDVPGWIENYRDHATAILEAMVEDGALLAFDLWVRHTGGEHNLRYNYVLPDFEAVAEAGGRYMERMDPASMAAFGQLAPTLRESSDGIWYIGDSNLPDDRPLAPYVYESAYQIEAASRERWNADFERSARPALERAMEVGLISAWARLDHSIGGPWNTKTLLWMTSWAAIEDVLELLDQPATAAGSIVLDRSDTIWTPVPPSGS